MIRLRSLSRGIVTSPCARHGLTLWQRAPGDAKVQTMRIREYAPLCLTTDPGQGGISRGLAWIDASASMRRMVVRRQESIEARHLDSGETRRRAFHESGARGGGFVADERCRADGLRSRGRHRARTASRRERGSQGSLSAAVTEALFQVRGARERA